MDAPLPALLIHRCGELLQEIPAAASRHDVTSGGAPTGRMQAGRDAGMSRDQTIRVARRHEVKDIRDKARAFEVYARQAQNVDAEYGCEPNAKPGSY